MWGMYQVIANLHYDMLHFSFCCRQNPLKSECDCPCGEVIKKQPHTQTSHLLDLEWSGLALWVILREFSWGSQQQQQQQQHSCLQSRSAECPVWTVGYVVAFFLWALCQVSYLIRNHLKHMMQKKKKNQSSWHCMTKRNLTYPKSIWGSSVCEVSCWLF